MEATHAGAAEAFSRKWEGKGCVHLLRLVHSRASLAWHRPVPMPSPDRPPPHSYRPQSASLAETRPDFQTAHLRPVVSRFGGMIEESNAIHIPNQSWEQRALTDRKDFESRHKAEHSNVYAGIPGYMGYKPHGSHATAYVGRRSAPKPHGSSRSHLDTSMQPYIMPVVGYSGHVRLGRHSFGTSHWKNAGYVTGNRAAASKPWDGRDSDGRPFGGQIPSDGGLYTPDPDVDLKMKEAAEANELLELRSMGIRALIAKSPEVQATILLKHSTPGDYRMCVR